jgi:hypothetical protein
MWLSTPLYKDKYSHSLPPKCLSVQNYPVDFNHMHTAVFPRWTNTWFHPNAHKGLSSLLTKLDFKPRFTSGKISFRYKRRRRVPLICQCSTSIKALNNVTGNENYEHNIGKEDVNGESKADSQVLLTLRRTAWLTRRVSSGISSLENSAK